MIRANFLGKTTASKQCDHKLPLSLLNYFQESVTDHILKQLKHDQYIFGKVTQSEQNSTFTMDVYIAVRS